MLHAQASSERGSALFVKFACSRCHGAQAEGDYGPRLAGADLDFEAVRRQVRNPKGLMPKFPEDRLGKGDLEDIYAFLQSLAPDIEVYPTWFGTDLLNLPTPETPDPHELEVHFSHRFAQSTSDAGREGLYGLDSFAFPAFYFIQGLTERLAVYGGRSSNLATWEYGTKVRLLEEGQIGLPISVGATIGGTFLDANGISNNNRFVAEIPVGVRLHDRVSFLAVPFFTTNPDELDNPDSDDYSAALGLGGTFRVTPHYSIDAEWIRNVGGFKRRDAVDQWQAALGIKVGGHVFQLLVSNSIFTTPDFMAAGTQNTGVKGNIRLGFNLVRSFRFIGSGG
ncbi:MAG: DUF5777 family beta-barrel protein [Acidobacteriota bacterium]